MTDCQREETRAFCVSVNFTSAGEAYASESFSIMASDEFDAERIGRDRAEASPYHDERIPDLGLIVVVDIGSPPEPDDDPPVEAALTRKGASDGSLP